MACIYVNPKTKNELVLGNILREYYKLDDSQESSDFLDSKVKMFFSDSFKDLFGDWINEDKSLFGKRVNEFGEPILFKDGENFYVLDKNNEKYFINNKRFEGLEQYGFYNELSRIREEGTSKIVSYIFNKHKNDDEDITDIDNISFNLMSEIENFFKQQVKENPDLEGDMEVLSEFKEDFFKDVVDFLSNINISYNEDEDTDDQAYQDSLEDSGSIVSKGSIEKNSKDNATASVKLMMSLIPDIESESEFFTGFKLLPFSKVWNDVQATLSKIPKLMSKVDGGAVDPLTIMIERLNKMAVHKPYIQELVKVLQSSSPNLQTQFVQAFFNNDKYIQDTLEVDTERYDYRLINAAESSSKKSKLLTEAGHSFKAVFTTLDTATGKRVFDLAIYNTFRKKYLDLQRNEKDNKGLLIQLKNINKTINNKPSSELLERQDELVKSTSKLLNELIIELGFPMTPTAYSYFLSENGRLREPTVESIIRQADAFVEGFNYIDKFIIPNITADPIQQVSEGTSRLFNKNNKFLNPYKGEKSEITGQRIINEIAEAIAYVDTDMSENMFFSGSTQMWVYSQASHLYDTVNILNTDKNEALKRLELPFTRNSVYLDLYRQAVLDGTDRDVIRIHRTSSMMEKDKAYESKDNVTTAKIDAINREIYEALLGKKPTSNSIFPTAVAADKPTTLKLEVNKFVETNTVRNEEGEIEIPEEITDIFIGYLEDDLSTAIEAKKFISDNTDSKGNVDISKLTQYRHVTADGYVFDILNVKGESIFKKGEVSSSIRNNVIEVDKLAASHPGYRKIYAGGVFKNFMTPSLSAENLIDKPSIFKYFYQADFTPINVNKLTTQQRTVVRPLIEQALVSQIETNLQSAVSNKIFKRNFARSTFDKSLYRLYSSDFDLITQRPEEEMRSLYKTIATDIIADYTINSTIAQVEFSKIFNGSINSHKNPIDYFKRVPKTYIDGKGLRLGVEKEDVKFNITVLQDMETSSPYISEMGEIGKRFYSKGKINQADAQAYITPERWKFLLERLGQFGKNEKKVYDKIQRIEAGENVQLETKELKTLSTKPLKGVYFSNINNDPVYLKYSQTVLLKSLVKGSPLEALLDQMRKQNISEAIMNSGVKVGARLLEEDVSKQILDRELKTLNSIPLDNRFWKLQQDLPNKGFKETLLGSQIQKNIFDNFNFSGTYQYGDKIFTGEEVYNNIHTSIGELSNRGIAKIIKKFQIDSDYIIRNWSSFAKDISDQLRKEKINENIISAVEKELTPYVIPQAKDKILSTIMSIINKSAVKLKTNGGSLIQMSNFGLDQNLAEDTGILWLKDKNQLAEPRRILQDDGTPLVIPGQCFVSGNILGQYIPNWRDYSLDELFGKDRKGGIFPREILQMIGYRIPNQAMSSNDALEIVGILPDTYIDTIVPYTGITTKTGSDFDIDKMFIILPSLRTKYTSNRQLLDNFYRGNNLVETTDLLEQVIDDLDINISNDELMKLVLSTDDVSNKEIKNLYRDRIIDALLNDKKASKEFRKINKNNIKIEKVEYVKWEDSKSEREQSTEAVNNRLFEMYHAILTQPDNYDNLITPIDHAHIKDFITKDLFPISANMKDYQAFSALYQIEMKYEFIAGKFGIGQVANQLVDSIMNQVAQERLEHYLGWGNSIHIPYINSKGEEALRPVTVFDMKSEQGVYDETGTYKISDSLTALLNGFVDIAKDPYITRGNWNTQTTNTGTMLIRAGVHPYKVLGFLAQPALIEMVNITSEREGILTKEGTSATVIPELKTKYEKELKKALVASKVLKNGKDPYWSIILKEINNKAKVEINVAPGIVTNNRIQERSIEDLKRNIVMNRTSDTRDTQFFLDQLLALKEYERIKPFVKEFTKSVSASKYGETGAGSSMISNIVQTNKTSDVYYRNAIVNFDKKFFNKQTLTEGYTSLGIYHKNSEIFVNSLINANPKIFITGNDFFKGIMNDMVSEIHKNKKYLDDEDLGSDVFEKAFYTMITSESRLFKMQDEKIQRGDRSIPKEFFYLFTKPNSITPITLSDLVETTRQRLREENQSNFFLDNLEIKEDNNFVFIGIEGLRLKPNDFSDKIIQGWRDLEREYPDLAEDLVKYAYQQSGFRYNANQIYQYIPHEFFVKNNFNEYINRVAADIDTIRIDSRIIEDNIYRHNWNNTKVVPAFSSKNFATKLNKATDMNEPVIYQDRTGFRVDSYSNRHSGKGYIGDQAIKTFPRFVSYSDNLYQLHSYLYRGTDDNGAIYDPVYFKTHKLGYRSDKGQLHEYTMYESKPESNVRENNLNETEKSIIEKNKDILNRLGAIPYDEVDIEKFEVRAVKTFDINSLVSDVEVVDLQEETIEPVKESTDELEKKVIDFPAIDHQNVIEQLIEGEYYIEEGTDEESKPVKITSENVNKSFDKDTQIIYKNGKGNFVESDVPEVNHYIEVNSGMASEYDKIEKVYKDALSDKIPEDEKKVLKDYLRNYGINIVDSTDSVKDPNQTSLWEEEDNDCPTPF